MSVPFCVARLLSKYSMSVKTRVVFFVVLFAIREPIASFTISIDNPVPTIIIPSNNRLSDMVLYNG